MEYSSAEITPMLKCIHVIHLCNYYDHPIQPVKEYKQNSFLSLSFRLVSVSCDWAEMILEHDI